MRRPRNLLGPQGMGGLVSLWGASSLIRSVQRGTITITGATSATATITAVDVANTRLRWLGSRASITAVNGQQYFANLVLTNSTTVTATVVTSPGVNSCIVGYEITEYMPGVVKSIQQGELSVAGTTATTTITRVNVDKTELSFNGFRDNDTSNNNGVFATVALTDGVTVSATNVVGSTLYVTWQAVEFF